jgi:hypothetical protein
MCGNDNCGMAGMTSNFDKNSLKPTFDNLCHEGYNLDDNLKLRKTCGIVILFQEVKHEETSL